MTDLRTAAQRALDDLRDLHANHNITYAGTISRLEAALAQPNTAQQVVDEQAEDEGLWFRAQTAAEAYLQQELRRLHAAVEGEKT